MMIEKKIKIDLAHIAHERSHEDCYAEVTVRIPELHHDCMLGDVPLDEDAPQEWVIAKVEIPRDIRTYLDNLYTNYDALRWAVFEHLINRLDDLVEIVDETIYEEQQNGL